MGKVRNKIANGRIAVRAPGLTPAQRMALAAETTPEGKGEIAAYAPGLTPGQRMALAAETTPWCKGEIAA